MLFVNRYNLTGGGTLGLPSLSCYDYNGNYILFRLQEECVIRLTVTTAATAQVSVVVGGETVSGIVSFAVSNVQYFVLNDLFRALFVKTFPTSTTFSGITGVLTVELFTASGTSLGTTSQAIYVCDSGGVQSAGVDGLSHNFPDTFLFASGVAFGSYNYFTLRAVGGLVEVITESQTGNVMETYTRPRADTASISGRAAWRQAPSTCPALITGGDSGGDQVSATPIFWDDGCGTDSVPVVWWSSVDGGYKTRVAKIRNLSDRTAGSSDVLQLFTRSAVKETVLGVALRFERLTLNDYAYYRDILSSGEVYVLASVMTATGAADEKIPVVVHGDYPTAAVGGVDLDFSVELTSISNL